MKYILATLISSLLFISGCRTVDYTIHPDGTRDVKYRVFGFDTKIGGLEVESNGDNKKVIIRDLDTNSSNAFGVLSKLVDKVPSAGTTNVVVPPINPALPSPAPARLPPTRPSTNPVN